MTACAVRAPSSFSSSALGTLQLPSISLPPKSQSWKLLHAFSWEYSEHPSSLTKPAPAHSSPGTLPNLTALTSLSFLDISSNKWNGTLPPLPQSLIYLNTSSTPLSGNLPAVPITLQTLDGSYSQLSGTLPPSLSSPPLLQWIDLRVNALHGSVPPLPLQLQFLSLSSNALSGSLPLLLPDGIQYATLDSNRLSGSLPPSWGMASSIRWVRVCAEVRLTCSMLQTGTKAL